MHTRPDTHCMGGFRSDISLAQKQLHTFDRKAAARRRRRRRRQRSEKMLLFHAPGPRRHCVSACALFERNVVCACSRNSQHTHTCTHIANTNEPMKLYFKFNLNNLSQRPLCPTRIRRAASWYLRARRKLSNVCVFIIHTHARTHTHIHMPSHVLSHSLLLSVAEENIIFAGWRRSRRWRRWRMCICACVDSALSPRHKWREYTHVRCAGADKYTCTSTCVCVEGVSAISAWRFCGLVVWRWDGGGDAAVVGCF